MREQHILEEDCLGTSAAELWPAYGTLPCGTAVAAASRLAPRLRVHHREEWGWDGSWDKFNL